MFILCTELQVISGTLEFTYADLFAAAKALAASMEGGYRAHTQGTVVKYANALLEECDVM